MDSPKVHLLPQTNSLLAFMTLLRDANTPSKAFAQTFEKISSKLVSAALDLLPTESVDVKSPTGAIYSGIKHTKPVCGLSILRAGASLENALRDSYTGPLSFGKILIQRDETTCLPTHLYSKYPQDMSKKTVLMLEPMLATGGSASLAIDIIKKTGVLESDIIFVNVVASRQGLEYLTSRFPQIHVVTAAIDENMTPSKHISPGLGDFGDRFYGTTD